MGRVPKTAYRRQRARQGPCRGLTTAWGCWCGLMAVAYAPQSQRSSWHLPPAPGRVHLTVTGLQARQENDETQPRTAPVRLKLQVRTVWQSLWTFGPPAVCATAMFGATPSNRTAAAAIADNDRRIGSASQTLGLRRAVFVTRMQPEARGSGLTIGGRAKTVVIRQQRSRRSAGGVNG
jgi:hypothetical protein